MIPTFLAIKEPLQLLVRVAGVTALNHQPPMRPDLAQSLCQAKVSKPRVGSEDTRRSFEFSLFDEAHSRCSPRTVLLRVFSF